MPLEFNYIPPWETFEKQGSKKTPTTWSKKKKRYKNENDDLIKAII